ncbi:MAG: BON domain-containing protein [Magnetospirillum sp.]|nr:BON domain-containing protein [Magnetospirillum sp.]
MATIMIKRLARTILSLGLLQLAACAQPPNSASTPQSQLSTDSQGRVVRLRADRNIDDSVGQAVHALLMSTDRDAFRGVSVRVWDGALLLTGAVAKPDQRRRAEQLAKSVDGVATIFDELVLVENPGLTIYVPDTHREQKIYAGLLGQDGLAGAYTVRVVNGVAYLLGSSNSADDVVKAAAFTRDYDGIKWVVEHVSVR